jgi:hypothetical protein
MMLFDPEVGLSIKEGNVAGRQKGEEKLMSAIVKQRKTGVGECYLEARERSPRTEVNTANEITCDYVWDKMYPLISVICSKWYIRKTFVLGAQSLHSSLLSCCRLA